MQSFQNNFEKSDIIEIMKINGNALKYLDKKYTDDYEIVFEAVK